MPQPVKDTRKKTKTLKNEREKIAISNIYTLLIISVKFTHDYSFWSVRFKIVSTLFREIIFFVVVKIVNIKLRKKYVNLFQFESRNLNEISRGAIEIS